ncbi:uncharacterized protein LOC144578246 [Callithrix jacchus]
MQIPGRLSDVPRAADSPRLHAHTHSHTHRHSQTLAHRYTREHTHIQSLRHTRARTRAHTLSRPGGPSTAQGGGLPSFCRSRRCGTAASGLSPGSQPERDVWTALCTSPRIRRDGPRLPGRTRELGLPFAEPLPPSGLGPLEPFPPSACVPSFVPFPSPARPRTPLPGPAGPTSPRTAVPRAPGRISGSLGRAGTAGGAARGRAAAGAGDAMALRPPPFCPPSLPLPPASPWGPRRARAPVGSPPPPAPAARFPRSAQRRLARRPGLLLLPRLRDDLCDARPLLPTHPARPSELIRSWRAPGPVATATPLPGPGPARSRGPADSRGAPGPGLRPGL